MRTGRQIISHCWEKPGPAVVPVMPGLLVLILLCSQDSGSGMMKIYRCQMNKEGGRRHVCGVVSVKKPLLFYPTVKCFRFQNRSGFQHVGSRVCWQQKIAQMLVIIPTLRIKCRSIFVISIQEKF